MKLIGRLLILPFKLALAAIAAAVQAFGLVFRAGRFVGGVPMRAGRRTARVMGVRGVIGLAVGLAVGLLFAPGPGRELRDRLKALQAARGRVDDGDLAERVTFELEHAPRTWHLPQPTVTVVAGWVILSGTVSQAPDHDELGGVAAAVPGVVAVDNLLEVGETDSAPS